MAKTQKTTATIAGVPSTELVRIEKETKPVVLAAGKLVIKDSDSETEAYQVLTQIKKHIDGIEAKRTAITKPLNASLKEVNALFKQLTKPLTQADTIIRDKILSFRQVREEQAQARQQKLLEKAQNEPDEAKAEQLQMKAEAVLANVGDSQTTKRWTFDLVDIAKVPVQYLDIDNGAIREAIRQGERDIPGLKIYQEESVRVV
ncbi:MAG: hypothetical protein PHF37_05830 [Phycisphaerae bacterium]|jgi:acyl-CoA-binding protein|nr:hypothetical protein [Phycisphaerae bacterium]